MDDQDIMQIETAAGGTEVELQVEKPTEQPEQDNNAAESTEPEP